MSQTTTERKTGKNTSPVAHLVDFYAYTGTLIDPETGQSSNSPITRAYNSGGDTMIFRAVGSSELVDLEGDRMMRSVLQDMTTLAPNSVVFANHDYTMPESAMARMIDNPQFEVKTLQKATRTAPAGAEVGFVTFEAQILDNNPRAMQMWGYLERSLKLDISVGIQVTDYDIRVDKSNKPEGLDILHGIPLEFSTVGIGCNRDSMVAACCRGIMSRRSVHLSDDPTEADYMLRNWGDFDDLDCLYLRRLNEELLRPKGLTITRLPRPEAKSG